MKMVWNSTGWKWVAVCALLVAHQVAAQVEDGAQPTATPLSRTEGPGTPTDGAARSPELSFGARRRGSILGSRCPWIHPHQQTLERVHFQTCLLINGDFETPPPGGFSNFGVSDGPVSIPSWKANGTVEIISSGEKQGGMILIVPEGEHAVRLGNDAEISQEVKLEKGSIYSVTFSAARTCAQLESLNVSVPPASQTIDLQTLYSVQGWDTYAWAVQVEEDDVRVVFRNPGMEDDPTCGPIIDDIAVKKLFVPEKVKDNAVLNGDFEEGPWMFRNASLGVLLPTNLDEETSSLPGWIVESNRAVRYIDSNHFTVPEGKRAIELLSGKEGIISQMVVTKPNKPYRLSFSLGHANDKCKQPLAVMAFAGDQAENIHYTPNSNATFQTADVNFTAKAERKRVAFYSVYYNTRSDDMTSLCGPVIDDVRVAISRSFRIKLGGIVLMLALACSLFGM